MQPLLPAFTRAFDISPAASSLAVSLTTGFLAGAILFVGAISDRFGRKAMIMAALVAAALLTLAVAAAPSWTLLLVLRALTGLALSGVPAIAMTYLAEEVDAPSIGLAVGLTIGGNVFGGMAGRLFAGVLADLMGWRVAIGMVGVAGLLSALVFWKLAPPSRNFAPRRRSGQDLFAAYVAPFRDKGLPLLFVEAFICMGVFVALYNYMGFHLLAPPYSLSQGWVSAIFVCYLLGVVASAWIGDLAGRIGRRKVFWAPLVLMMLGLGLTALEPLPVVVLGIGLFTFGFFGAHSVASSWVGRRAGAYRAQASSIFLFFYYLGGSVIGWAGGYVWTRASWSGFTLALAALMALALVMAARLAFVEPKAPPA